MTLRVARVSVVLALHNGLPFLPEQVRSVLADLHAGDELIVVDDASRDGSAAWIEALGDPRITLERNEANLGVRRTFERGLALAQHEVVFLCDQDDVWLAGKRDAFVEAFAHTPTAQVVVSDAEVIDSEGTLVAPSFMAIRGGFRSGVVATLVKNRYLGCAMALRRRAITAALPIPRTVPMHDMWLGVVARLVGGTVYLGVPLLRYRRHGGNVSPSRRQGIVTMMGWRVALLFAVLSRLPRILRERRALRDDCP
jgi:glycosyltransferase involved in cell wall biosynthesis